MLHTSNERRQHKRFEIALSTTLDVGESEPYLALTQDFSRSGARVLSDVRPRIGDTAVVVLRLDRYQETSWPARVVRWVDVLDRGPWRREIAFRFDPPVPRYVEALIASLDAESYRP